MRNPSATADPPTEWRRYVFLRHELPSRQQHTGPTSPREPLSPAGGDSASGGDAMGPPETEWAVSRGSHFDLMFETAAGLLTWAVDRLPVIGQPPQPALSLPLHRAAYLDYEGPVSGDRGSVRRVQAGIYRPASGREEHSLPKGLAADHFAFVCQRRDQDAQPVAQLVLFDRVDDGGWELRSIIAPPK